MPVFSHHADLLSSSDATLATVLDAAKNSLRPYQETADLDAEILLAHVLSSTRSILHTWPERVLSNAQLAQFDELIERRAGGEPVAYITGRREFWSLELQVTPATLIPRPETELLVELALQRIPAQETWRIADLGTGSGAIALALAHERLDCKIIATDISSAALEVANVNAARLGMNSIEFKLATDANHWCMPLHGACFDMIVSNPPYVSSADPHLASGDVRFEPRLALEAGADGLQHLRAIAADARQYLAPAAWLVLEHGFDQGRALVQLLTDLGYENVQDHIDLAGHGRIITAQFGGEKKLS